MLVEPRDAIVSPPCPPGGTRSIPHGNRLPARPAAVSGRIALSTHQPYCWAAAMAAATPAMAQDGLPPAPPSTANPQDEAAPASASPAQAVPPSTPGQAPVDASASQGIIVKAERRFNTAEKTAAAITVRPGAEMLRQGRYELKNILEDVPGVVGAPPRRSRRRRAAAPARTISVNIERTSNSTSVPSKSPTSRGPHLVPECDDRGARYGVQRRPDHPDARRQVRHASVADLQHAERFKVQLADRCDILSQYADHREQPV